MNVPSDLLYSKEHEWVRREGDTVVIGITDYAQEQLGDVVFVDLPSVERSFARNAALASLESVKAVSEVYSPLSGTVTEINQDVADNPEKINNDPYGEGWIVRLQPSDPGEFDKLLSAEAYTAYVEEEAKH